MIKITTLIENSAIGNSNLKVEHGLSFLIEKDTTSILFDTGQTGDFIENAKALGCDLSRVKHVILSHGHYDHTGGVRAFIKKFGSDFNLWVNKKIFEDKFSIRKGKSCFSGNKFDLEYLQLKGVKINFLNSNVTTIVPGVNIVTNFLRSFSSENITGRFKMVEGKYREDDFSDEAMVVLETSEGLLNIVGCSHPGIMNMITTVKERISSDFYGIIGGTHLCEADEARILETRDFFQQCGFKKIGVSHCTGENAIKILSKMQGIFFNNNTGSILTID